MKIVEFLRIMGLDREEFRKNKWQIFIMALWTAIFIILKVFAYPGDAQGYWLQAFFVSLGIVLLIEITLNLIFRKLRRNDNGR